MPEHRDGPWNRGRLADALRDAGTDQSAFSLDGDPGVGERYVLELVPGGWAVYYAERGLRQGERRFDTEAEGCSYFYGLVTDDPTTSLTRPPASRRYVSMIRDLLDGLQPSEFCDRFMTMWREDRDAHRRTGAVIDGLMTAVDCYDVDAVANDPWAINASELRAEAEAALEALTE